MVRCVRVAVHREEVRQALTQFVVVDSVGSEIKQDEAVQDLLAHDGEEGWGGSAVWGRERWEVKAHLFVRDHAGQEELGDSDNGGRGGTVVLLVECTREETKDDVRLRVVQVSDGFLSRGEKKKRKRRKEKRATHTKPPLLPKVNPMQHQQIKQRLQHPNLQLPLRRLTLPRQQLKRVERHRLVEEAAEAETDESLRADVVVFGFDCRDDQLGDEAVEHRVFLEGLRGREGRD